MESNTLTLVLSYRDPAYGRFRGLLEAARHLSGYKFQLIQNTSTGILRYWQTFWKLLWRKERAGAYLLGFRGLEFYWILRFVVGKSPIILDALVSPSLALQKEKQSLLTVLSSWIFRIEKNIYHNAQCLLVDTDSHRQLLAKTFDLPLHKLVVVPVGAEEMLFTPVKTQQDRTFTVLYYFSGQKLHGEEILHEMLQNLQNQSIRFLLIGPQAKNFSDYRNVDTISSVPYKLLPHIISQADLCLVGPFTDSSQANRVITTKTFQCLAMKKPVILGKNVETEKYFSHQKNALIVPLSNAKVLQKNILWGYKNRKTLQNIAYSGWVTYKQHFSSQVRAHQLKAVLKHV